MAALLAEPALQQPEEMRRQRDRAIDDLTALFQAPERYISGLKVDAILGQR